VKGLFLIFMFVSVSVIGQKLYKTPYQRKMDSTAIANLHFNLGLTKKGNIKVYYYQPVSFVKFSISTRLNTNLLTRLNFDNNFKGVFNNLEVDDYFSLGRFDIRCKVYLNKRVRLVGTMIVNGVRTNKYTYNTGLIIKF